MGTRMFLIGLPKDRQMPESTTKIDEGWLPPCLIPDYG
jgi:hypothetical protein